MITAASMVRARGAAPHFEAGEAGCCGARRGARRRCYCRSAAAAAQCAGMHLHRPCERAACAWPPPHGACRPSAQTAQRRGGSGRGAAGREATLHALCGAAPACMACAEHAWWLGALLLPSRRGRRIAGATHACTGATQRGGGCRCGMVARARPPYGKIAHELW